MRAIHIINPFENAFGGSEQRALALAGLLKDAGEVKLWSTSRPDPRLRSPLPIVPADIAKARFPRSGTFIFVGAYFPAPMWVSVAKPERAILVYNVPFAPHLRENLRILQAYEVPRIDVVVAAPSLAPHVEELGLKPVFEPSWIDLKRFAVKGERPDRPFTIGRLSRDVPEKFHEEDAALFRTLADRDVRVRLMGATCLRRALGGHPNIEILPSGALPAERFLAGIDAFVYRTNPAWKEAWGRVVGEAIASGTPVVLDHRIGFLEALENEKSALVFQTTEQAIANVERLRESPSLAFELQAGALRALRRLYGPEQKRAMIEFYLAGKRNSALPATL